MSHNFVHWCTSMQSFRVSADFSPSRWLKGGFSRIRDVADEHRPWNPGGGRGSLAVGQGYPRGLSRPRSSSRSLVFFDNIARALFIVCSRVCSRLRCLAPCIWMHMDSCLRFPMLDPSVMDKLVELWQNERRCKNGEETTFRLYWEFHIDLRFAEKSRAIENFGVWKIWTRV